jgi:hypothetical protein
MACGHQRRGASPTPDQEETNGSSLFTLFKRIGLAAPQYFPNGLKQQLRKGRHGD